MEEHAALRVDQQLVLVRAEIEDLEPPIVRPAWPGADANRVAAAVAHPVEHVEIEAAR